MNVMSIVSKHIGPDPFTQSVFLREEGGRGLEGVGELVACLASARRQLRS